MTTLVKASLCEVAGNDSGTEVGSPIEVQFNPTSLRVQVGNKTAGGQQAGSQTRQRPGTGEITVSFDLVFDTADEGTTDAPVPVTRKTQIVEKFVRPQGSAPNQQTPPRVQFKWGTFLVQGVMDSVNIELDLFAADGTPLRAKVSVQIKGQDPQYRYDPILPPSAGGPSAGGPPPGPMDPPPGMPGTQGGADTPTQVAQAMPGESLSQLATRNGLDPSAWRALAVGISNPLSLSAGLEVALPASLKAGSNVSGTKGGGTDPSTFTAQLPLVNNSSLPVGKAADSPPAAAANRPSSPVQSGLALTGQGGVAASIASLRSDAQRSAVSTAISGFGLASAAAQAANSTPAQRPYGGGVPLRPLYGDPNTALPLTNNPTLPGWIALQQRPSAAVQPLQQSTTNSGSTAGCGCGPSSITSKP